MDSFSLPTIPNPGMENQPTGKPGKRLLYLWLAIATIVGLVLGGGLGLIFASGSNPVNGLKPTNPQAQLASANNPTAPGTTATVPPKQPAGTNHFAFGVDSHPGDVQYMNDMRSKNGTAFDYRYQYVSGGVNTGHGWETWNTPSGAFATLYKIGRAH